MSIMSQEISYKIKYQRSHDISKEAQLFLCLLGNITMALKLHKNIKTRR